MKYILSLFLCLACGSLFGQINTNAIYGSWVKTAITYKDGGELPDDNILKNTDVNRFTAPENECFTGEYSVLLLDFDNKDSLKYMIREVNIDTSNFKASNFELNDLSFLVEIANLSDKDTVLRNFNKMEFKATVLMRKKTEYFKLNNFSTPVYTANGRNYDLKVYHKQKVYVIIGITCLELDQTKQYAGLTNEQKMETLERIIKNVKISFGSKAILFNRAKVKVLYRSIYYPHDPNKYYPLRPKTTVIKSN